MGTINSRVLKNKTLGPLDRRVKCLLNPLLVVCTPLQKPRLQMRCAHRFRNLAYKCARLRETALPMLMIPVVRAVLMSVNLQHDATSLICERRYCMLRTSRRNARAGNDPPPPSDRYNMTRETLSRNTSCCGTQWAHCFID